MRGGARQGSGCTPGWLGGFYDDTADHFSRTAAANNVWDQTTYVGITATSPSAFAYGGGGNLLWWQSFGRDLDVVLQ